MIKTFGVLKSVNHKFFLLIDEQSKRQKSLNDSDDEMIIKNIKETKYLNYKIL